jgi:hypothetical protein
VRAPYHAALGREADEARWSAWGALLPFVDRFYADYVDRAEH